MRRFSTPRLNRNPTPINSLVYFSYQPRLILEFYDSDVMPGDVFAVIPNFQLVIQ